MLNLRQSDSSDRAGRVMDVEKFLLLVKDQEAIYDASRCEHRNRVLL
jgi:hypothetical protein